MLMEPIKIKYPSARLRYLWLKYPAIADYLLKKEVVKYRELNEDLKHKMKTLGFDPEKYKEITLKDTGFQTNNIDKIIDTKPEIDNRSDEFDHEPQTITLKNTEETLKQSETTMKGFRFNLSVGKLKMSGDVEFY